MTFVRAYPDLISASIVAAGLCFCFNPRFEECRAEETGWPAISGIDCHPLWSRNNHCCGRY